MNIFDDFMANSHLSGSFLVTHERVIKVKEDDYETPSFEDSETVTETFMAVTSGRSSYEWKFKDYGEIRENDDDIVVPSDRVYNEFINKGVKDRLKIGEDWFEIDEVHDDTFMGNRQVVLKISHLTGQRT
jgi:hypothetical protein